MIKLTIPQEEVINSAGTSFLLGVAGTGKTTALHNRLLHLLESGETAYAILVIVSEPRSPQILSKRCPYVRFRAICGTEHHHLQSDGVRDGQSLLAFGGTLGWV